METIIVDYYGSKNRYSKWKFPDEHEELTFQEFKKTDEYIEIKENEYKLLKQQILRDLSIPVALLEAGIEVDLSTDVEDVIIDAVSNWLTDGF